eukprot:scaffold67237_cov66-Phaeocystis_antarctica.AAC.1
MLALRRTSPCQAALKHACCTAAPPPWSRTHCRRHRCSLRSFTHAPARISWHRCTGPPSRMNDELQPTNYTEACAKHLVRHEHTCPVNGGEADGTAKQAKSKQKKEALKAAADKADMAAHKADKADKAVSLAAPAEATKVVSSVQTTSPQAGCQVNRRHPQSPMARWTPAASPLAHRDAG